MLLFIFAATAALVSGQESDEPVAINRTLPYPYISGYIRLTRSAPDDKPTASISFMRANRCGGYTVFASTTTVPLPIDCMGASEIGTVSIGRPHCPLGRSALPATVDTVSEWPSTAFSFVCAPTPTPSVTDTASPPLVTDITRIMPLPTISPGQTPPERPVSLEVVHHPDGTCLVDLELVQVDSEHFANRRERIEHECREAKLRPTVWASTVTQAISVDCDGCAFIAGGAMTTACPRSLTELPAATMTASVPHATTRWLYDCSPRSGGRGKDWR